MSQANDLLQTLAASQTQTQEPEDTTTLVIDHYLRTIKIPKDITTLGVEYDDDVMYLNFKMPRYLDKTDLSAFTIRINYINANGESDVYTVKSPTVTSTYIAFSWLVGPTATAYKGKTKFNVCLKLTDSEGVVQKEYNTAIASLPVLEGLETDPAIISEYTDILEQWRRELFGIGDTEEANIKAASQTEQEAISQKGVEVLATIPEDYTTAYNLANEAVRTKADAIICSAEGEIIKVSDSSDDHLRGLRVFGKTTQVSTTGKNLLNVDERFTLSNVLGIDVSLDADTYIVSITSESHSGDQQPYIRFYNNNVWIQLKNGLAQSAVLSQPETMVYLYTYGMSASESVGVTATFNQLMVSKTGGAYEPYSGGIASPSPEWPQELTVTENPIVDVYGKNLLKEPAIGSTSTGNGITCAYEGNGIYHFTGTYEQITDSVGFVNTWMNMPVDQNAEYTISAKLIEGSTHYYFHPYIGLSSDNDAHRNWLVAHVTPTTPVGSVITATGTPKMYLSDAKALNKFWIYLYDDTGEVHTVDFRIQVWVEQSSKSTEYTPYSKQSFNLSHTLPGIPVTSGGNYTDSNGQQWICDEIDFERGVYVQHFKSLAFTGQENWVQDTNYTCTYRVGAGYIAIGGLCTHYPTYFITEDIGSVSGVYLAYTVNHIITDTRFVNDLAGFTEFLAEEYASGNPVTVLRRLNEPIETPLSADEIAAFQALKSNYPSTTVLNDAGTGMILCYNADTETWITNLIDEKIVAAVAKL